MLYLFLIFMFGCGYYTFTFGVSLWKSNNKLGGFWAAAFAVVGTILPAVVLLIKS